MVDRLLVRSYGSSLKMASNSARADIKSGRIISTNTNASISAWINMIGAGGGNGYVIYCERAATGNNIYKLQINTSRKLTFTHRSDNNSLTQPTQTGQIAFRRWTHVGVVKAGTAIKFYINGKADGTGSLNGNDTLTNSSPMTTIGYDVADTASSWYNGLLDEVRIFDTNLTDAQMLDIYLRGSTKNITPVGEWKMNEGSGSSIADTGSGGNTGSLTSATFSTNVFSGIRSAAVRT